MAATSRTASGTRVRAPADDRASSGLAPLVWLLLLLVVLALLAVLATPANGLAAATAA
jgi:hypothetical protein